MLTIAAFLVAIAVLVAVHEWGHFAMARACGVKVLCFSIGLGPVVFSRTSNATGTEFRLSALPLGGFVRMLDEREGPVLAAELPQAFNRQRLRSRALIVAAGPLANLILAVLLYSVVNWIGVEEPVARISKPAAGSIAQLAGLNGGETIIQLAIDGGPPHDVVSFEDLRWSVTRAALDKSQIELRYRLSNSDAIQHTLLNFTEVKGLQPDAGMMSKIGLDMPFSAPFIADVRSQGAAHEGGLEAGDFVREVDGVAIADAAELRQLIRATGLRQQGVAQTWVVERRGVLLSLSIQPRQESENGVFVGRVGAMIGAAPVMRTVRFGLLDGTWRAVNKTAEVAALTLRTMGQMVTGTASVKNLSGPLTIAEYAGRSASIGGTSFMVFLALVSISLGVLNLLPVPVLDGGHLLYYLWEALFRRPLSDIWMARLQRVGVALLLCMMSIAIFNDVSRLFF